MVVKFSIISFKKTVCLDRTSSKAEDMFNKTAAANETELNFAFFRSKKIAAKIRAEVEEERKENKQHGNTGSYWGSSYSSSNLAELKKSQNLMPK